MIAKEVRKAVAERGFAEDVRDAFVAGREGKMQKANSRAAASVACRGLRRALALTFAWFTDSVKNEGNRIQAGTLGIELFHHGRRRRDPRQRRAVGARYSEKADATVSNTAACG